MEPPALFAMIDIRARQLNREVMLTKTLMVLGMCGCWSSVAESLSVVGDVVA
jgi:hypothetical protein